MVPVLYTLSDMILLLIKYYNLYMYFKILVLITPKSIFPVHQTKGSGGALIYNNFS